MTADLVKVMFPLEAEAWHKYATERLWAQSVGSNRYRLRNSPFYARGVSLDDVVFADLDGDGQLVFRSVSLRGGHSTYRIMLKMAAESDAFRKHWLPLEALGCRYEGVGGKLLSIDVPSSADIYEVYARLEAGEESGVWDFEEGHCGHPLRIRETGATRETR